MAEMVPGQGMQSGVGHGVERSDGAGLCHQVQRSRPKGLACLHRQTWCFSGKRASVEVEVLQSAFLRRSLDSVQQLTCMHACVFRLHGATGSTGAVLLLAVLRTGHSSCVQECCPVKCQ